MALQDLGSLADYQLNGDNYTKIQPDGSTLVIPGNTINGKPSRPVAPSRETTDAYYILGDPCVPSSLSATCAAWVHDATTGYWHVGPIADFNSEFTSCVCALVSVEALDQDADCLAQLEIEIHDFDGQPLTAFFPGWWIALNGFDPFAALQIDKFIIACLPQFVIIPRVKPPPDPPVPLPLIDFAGGIPMSAFLPPGVVQITRANPAGTRGPRPIVLWKRLDNGPAQVRLPVELTGLSAWPVPYVVMAPECQACADAETPSEIEPIG